MTVLMASASTLPFAKHPAVRCYTVLCNIHTTQQCAAAPNLDVLHTRSLQPLLLGLPAGNIAYC